MKCGQSELQFKHSQQQLSSELRPIFGTFPFMLHTHKHIDGPSPALWKTAHCYTVAAQVEVPPSQLVTDVFRRFSCALPAGINVHLMLVGLVCLQFSRSFFFTLAIKGSFSVAARNAAIKEKTCFSHIGSVKPNTLSCCGCGPIHILGQTQQNSLCSHWQFLHCKYWKSSFV